MPPHPEAALFTEEEHADARRLCKLVNTSPRATAAFRQELAAADRDIPGYGDLFTAHWCHTLAMGIMAERPRFAGSPQVDAANHFYRRMLPKLASRLKETTISCYLRPRVRGEPKTRGGSKKKPKTPSFQAQAAAAAAEALGGSGEPPEPTDLPTLTEAQLAARQPIDLATVPRPPGPAPESSFRQEIRRMSDEELEAELSRLVPMSPAEVAQLQRYIHATKEQTVRQSVSRQGGTIYRLFIPTGDAWVEEATMFAREAAEKGLYYTVPVWADCHVWLQIEYQDQPRVHYQVPFNWKLPPIRFTEKLPIVEGSCLDPRTRLTTEQLKVLGEDPLYMDGAILMPSGTRRIIQGAELKQPEIPHVRWDTIKPDLAFVEYSAPQANQPKKMDHLVIRLSRYTRTPKRRPGSHPQQQQQLQLDKGDVTVTGASRKSRRRYFRPGRTACRLFEKQHLGPQEAREEEEEESKGEEKQDASEEWNDKMKQVFKVHPSCGSDPADIQAMAELLREQCEEVTTDLAALQAPAEEEEDEEADEEEEEDVLVPEDGRTPTKSKLMRLIQVINNEASRYLTALPAIMSKCRIGNVVTYWGAVLLLMGLGIESRDDMRVMIRGMDDDDTFWKYDAILNHTLSLDADCVKKVDAHLQAGQIRSPKDTVKQGAWWFKWRFMTMLNSRSKRVSCINHACWEKALVLSDFIRHALHLYAGIIPETRKQSLSNRHTLTTAEFLELNTWRGVCASVRKAGELLANVPILRNDQNGKRGVSGRKRRKTDAAAGASAAAAAAAATATATPEKGGKKKKAVEPFWIPFDWNLFPDAPVFSSKEWGRKLLHINPAGLFCPKVFDKRFSESKIPLGFKKKMEGENSIYQTVLQPNLPAIISQQRRIMDPQATTRGNDTARKRDVSATGSHCGHETPSGKKALNTKNLGHLCTISPGLSHTQIRSLECFLRCHLPKPRLFLSRVALWRRGIAVFRATMQSGRYSQVAIHGRVIGLTPDPDQLREMLHQIRTHPASGQDFWQMEVAYVAAPFKQLNIRVFSGRILRPVLTHTRHINGLPGPCLPNCVKQLLERELELVEDGISLSPERHPRLLELAAKVVQLLKGMGLITYIGPYEMEHSRLASMPTSGCLTGAEVDYFEIVPDAGKGMGAIANPFASHNFGLRQIIAVNTAKQCMAMVRVIHDYTANTHLELQYAERPLVRGLLSAAVDALPRGSNMSHVQASYNCENNEDAKTFTTAAQARGQLSYTLTTRSSMAAHRSLALAIKDTAEVLALSRAEKKTGLALLRNRNVVLDYLDRPQNWAERVAMQMVVVPEREDVLDPLTCVAPVGALVLPGQAVVRARKLGGGSFQKLAMEKDKEDPEVWDMRLFLRQQVAKYVAGMTLAQYRAHCLADLEPAIVQKQCDLESTKSIKKYLATGCGQVRKVQDRDVKQWCEKRVYTSETLLRAPGDKSNPRDGQKGVDSRYIPTHMQLWLADGSIPECLAGTHDFSRRTLSTTLEELAASAYLRCPNHILTTTHHPVNLAVDMLDSYLEPTQSYSPHFYLSMLHGELLCVLLDPNLGPDSWLQLQLDAEYLFPFAPMPPPTSLTIHELLRRPPGPVLVPAGPARAKTDRRARRLRQAFVSCMRATAREQCTEPESRTRLTWPHHTDQLAELWLQVFRTKFQAVLSILEVPDADADCKHVSDFLLPALKRRLRLCTGYPIRQLLNLMCQGPPVPDYDPAIPWSQLWSHRQSRTAAGAAGAGLLPRMSIEQCHTMLNRLTYLNTREVYGAISGEPHGRGKSGMRFVGAVNKRAWPQMRAPKPGVSNSKPGPESTPKVSRMEFDVLHEMGTEECVDDRKNSNCMVRAAVCTACRSLMTLNHETDEWFCVPCRKLQEEQRTYDSWSRDYRARLDPAQDHGAAAVVRAKIGLDQAPAPEDIKAQELITTDTQMQLHSVMHALGIGMEYQLSEPTAQPRYTAAQIVQS